MISQFVSLLANVQTLFPFMNGKWTPSVSVFKSVKMLLIVSSSTTMSRGEKRTVVLVWPIVDIILLTCVLIAVLANFLVKVSHLLLIQKSKHVFHILFFSD